MPNIDSLNETILTDRLVWDLDWSLLRTFAVIAEVRSITRAAERLNLRQPSVSNALRRLEERVGTRLVERSAARFELTPAGRLLQERSAAMFALVAELPDQLRGLDQEGGGHVVLALASHVESPHLDAALTAFQQRLPRATLAIEVLPSVAVARRVAEGSAALGLCLAGGREAELTYTLFCREFFGFFCGRPHPLFARPDVPLEAMRQLPQVSFQTDNIADALRPVALVRAAAGLAGVVRPGDATEALLAVGGAVVLAAAFWLLPQLAT